MYSACSNSGVSGRSLTNCSIGTRIKIRLGIDTGRSFGFVDKRIGPCFRKIDSAYGRQRHCNHVADLFRCIYRHPAVRAQVTLRYRPVIKVSSGLFERCSTGVARHISSGVCSATQRSYACKREMPCGIPISVAMRSISVSNALLRHVLEQA